MARAREAVLFSFMRAPLTQLDPLIDRTVLALEHIAIAKKKLADFIVSILEIKTI